MEQKTKRTKGVCARCGFFPLLLLAIAAASCTSEKEGGAPVGSQIAFRADAAAVTRAQVTSSVRKIGVFGYSHTGDWTTAAATAVPDYFNNCAVVDLSGAGVWTYGGEIRYWPMDGRNLSFFAYAPYIDVEDTFTLYPAAAGDAGAPAITYTVPVSVIDQIDLLWHKMPDQTLSSNNGRVDFKMDHALTRVDFQLKLAAEEAERPYIVKITEMTIVNAVGTGTLDLSKDLGDAALWTLQRPADETGLATYALTTATATLRALEFDARITAPAAEEFNPFAFNEMIPANHHLMLLPQPLAVQGDGLPQQKLIIKGTVENVLLGTTEPIDRELTLHCLALPEWKAGQGVTYQLTLSVENGTVIEVDIEGFLHGTPWVTENPNNPVEGEVV